MPKLSVRNLNVFGRRVLARVDYNVPLEREGGAMIVSDDARIVATIPTLNWLVERGAIVILAAHLGYPDGRREANLSLRPVAVRLAEVLGRPVKFVDDCVGEKVEGVVRSLVHGDVLLLENVRYHVEEESNDPAFAERLARVADVYVNDAFGAAHRAHASTEGVARSVRRRGGMSAAGLLMERELRTLGDELDRPERPFVVILGGAKVSDKITVIDRLLERADSVLIGGAMAHTFRLAQGFKIGNSLVERDRTGVALAALSKAKQRGVEFLLPIDSTCATWTAGEQRGEDGRSGRASGALRTIAGADVPDGEQGVDIGPATAAAFREVILGARTILWNGPMGVAEDERFAGGTNAVAQAVADATQVNGAKSIIGGGDTVNAVKKAGLGDRMTFMSTGGGASLRFLGGGGLPGVEALSDG